SNALQNSGTSLSDSTRSRSRVSLRSTPRHGLLASNSCFTAHEKMAEAAAKTWLARMGASMRPIMVRASARVTGRLQLAPARHYVAADQRVGLLPGLVVLLGA